MVNIQDSGPKPYVVNIEDLTIANENFRTTAWTGSHMQLTLMTIQPGDDIGLEVHDDHDQFLRVEQGRAKVVMGPAKDDLPYEVEAQHDYVALIPAGSWHNVINIGEQPLKLYSIYAPPEHQHGTVHATKSDAGGK